MGKIVTGISVDEDVLKKAKAIAKKNRRTFSSYVEGLLIRDQSTVITTDGINKPGQTIKRRRK